MKVVLSLMAYDGGVILENYETKSAPRQNQQSNMTRLIEEIKGDKAQ